MHQGYDLDKLYDKLNLTGKVTKVGRFSVGVGGCSNVWEGYCEGKKVAVKVIREIGVSSNEVTLKRRLVREIRAWSHLHHRNVLPLLGFAYSVDPGSKLASLVSPWMVNGTSKRYLESRSAGEKIRILTNVADGLCYLHRHDVVHGDIKGDNILIDEAFEPRLADFGLSKIVSESKAVGETVTHTQGFFGSLRWTAKELFSAPEEFGASGVTRESDIWAFGMTVLELFTSQPPYCKIRYDPQVIIAIHNGMLPDQPDAQYGLDDDMWALCTACWAENPALRPPTKSLAKRLWELEVKFKLEKAQQKKRKSREPDSPDKENGEANLERRLRKSPKLSTLAELDGESSSPGTPRSLSISSQEMVRTPSSGSISRSSSFSSIPSSSDSGSEGVYDIDPRKLFANNARSEWAVHPAWNGNGSRSRPERTYTEPVSNQRHGFVYPCHPNDMMRQTRSTGGILETGAGHLMSNLPPYASSDDLHLHHTDHLGYPYHQGDSGLQLIGLGGGEPNFTPYYNPLDEMSASQWTSVPGRHASLPHAPNNSFDSLYSPSAMPTPLASYMNPPSPSPSPFMPQDPIFSDTFPMGEAPLNDFTSATFYGHDSANVVDFNTMPHGVLSPALSELDTPYIPFTEEPSHIPNPSDTPVIGSYDSFDDFGGLESDFALFGGVSVDENVLQSGRFELTRKSSTSAASSRQGSGSTVTGKSSSSRSSAHSSRQSSSGAPPSDQTPRTPQLSPLL